MRSRFFESGGLWVLGQVALLAFGLLAGVLWSAQLKCTQATAVGWSLILVGAFCGVCGARALGRNLTPFTKPSAKAALVTSGIYGWIRHPLCTAVSCGAIGWGLVSESLRALICAGLLLLLLDRKARREEVHLLRIFPDYQDYARRVKGFIPWLY